MKTIILIYLLFILSLGSILRLWQLDKFPEGLQVDEVSFGYNAYSMLKTGKDEFGKFLPLTLRSFDDNKAAVYSYLDIPAIYLFGLNGFAVRLPTALFGILFIVLSFFLSFELTKNRKLSILASFLFAISPTSILLSRVQSEPLVATFFVLLGTYLFLVYQRNKSFLYLTSATIFWILSLFTSTIPRVFLVLFLPLLFILYKSKKTAISFGIVIIFSLFLFFTSSLSRYNQVSVFSSLHVVLPLEESIREDGPNQALLARIFHNKPISYGRYLINNYFDYLSFRFLFQEAELPAREHLVNMGVMYLFSFPLFIIGVWKIISNKKKWGYMVIAWILVVPLSMSFASDDTPNIHRFFMTILPLELATAYGLFSINGYLRLILVPIIIFSLAFFLHQLIIHQPVHKSPLRSFAYKQLISEVKTLEPSYHKIVFTTKESNTYIFLLFYDRIDPKSYQQSGAKGNFDNGQFGKYVFVHQDCPRPTEINTLYVQMGNCDTIPSRENLVAATYWRDGSIAFKLVDLPQSLNVKQL